MYYQFRNVKTRYLISTSGYFSDVGSENPESQVRILGEDSPHLVMILIIRLLPNITKHTLL